MPIDTSARIDEAKIDESEIGLILHSFTENVAVADSITKQKTATPTFIEGLAAKDSFSKFKTATRQVLGFLGIADYLEELMLKVHGPTVTKYDYPAIHVENDSR